MQFKFGGDSPHTLNGNWKEANEKFSGAETVYEQELLYENSSSAGVTLLPTKKPEPVSYTHLDVYKRQYLYQTSCCMCLMTI